MANARIYHTLSHSTYLCKYHVVFTPKYRGRVLADTYIKAELKRLFKQIAKWKGLTIHAWHVGDEHIHLYISIPPKHSVSYVMSILKGKSSAWLKKKTRKFPRGTLWARGYFVSTVGVNEITIQRYVTNQHKHQRELVQPKLPPVA